jgi:copper transport protein
MRRRPLVVASLVAMALGAASAAAPTAEAHARLIDSVPPDGVKLGSAPRHVELHFSEAISPRFRVAQLIDAHGRVVRGTVVGAGSSSSRLVVTAPRLRRGTYALTWRVLSQDDGHITGGAVTFGVRVRPSARGATSAAPGSTVAPGRAWMRWVDLILLSAIAGTLVVAALLSRLRARDGTPAALVERPQRALVRTAAAAAAAAAGIGVLLFLRQLDELRASVAPDATAADLLTARWGVLWLLREALLIDLAVIALALRRRSSPGVFAIAVLLLTGVVSVHALGGHAAADEEPGRAVAIAAAHVLAAGVWIGGVGAFALALATAGGGRAQLARACAPGFGRIAGCALGVVAVTGLLAAGDEVASIDALLTTDYGRTLLIKSGLVVLAAVFGATNALLLRRDRLPRLVRIEAAAGISVLLAAAVLASSPPAKGPEFAAPRPVAPAALVGRAGDLLVTTTVRPNRPGVNVISVLTASSLRPPPARVRGVTVRLQPATGGAGVGARLAPIGAGRFAGGATLPSQGAWRATTIVDRAARRSALSFTWSVEPPDPARPVIHSARRLSPVVDGAALAVSSALTLSALCLLWRRQRPRTIRLARIPAR